ncbi:solute carrier organic anion transporter family member 2A1-like [Portunus trituberculatus]|uniref:solute carrier organic anion transporter family member 2A1-like n=1 Tax=Portunus trituberculatus TaxID=210409 RepID=UPI001E1CD4C0|nr:solute carrier organic anion transporter family member 2A1-like [Portunus trituberculatus]
MCGNLDILTGHRVLWACVGVDLLVGCGVGALSYPHTPHHHHHHHHPYTTTTTTAAIIVGVGMGGVWVARCRPRARTLALLLAGVVGVAAAAHAPLAVLTCGGEGGLPGVLSMDGSTLALHRPCSEECQCSSEVSYDPVCVKDGPLELSYYSPCHAGCPPPPAQGHPLENCTCGGRAASVTPGLCHPCATHLLHTCLSCLAASLTPLVSIITLLLAVRCVNKGEKTIALGLKVTLWSMGRLLGPLLVGGLVGGACLVPGRACGGRGGRGWWAEGVSSWECYLYDPTVLGYILHGTSATSLTLAAILSLFLAREAAHIDLFGEPHPSPTIPTPDPFARALTAPESEEV